MSLESSWSLQPFHLSAKTFSYFTRSGGSFTQRNEPFLSLLAFIKVSMRTPTFNQSSATRMGEDSGRFEEIVFDQPMNKSLRLIASCPRC